MRQEEARRAEEARLADLIQRVRAWRQAADIRAYVEAARVAGATGRCEIDPRHLELWASWALTRVDQMDPLISDAPFPPGHNQDRKPKSLNFVEGVGPNP